MSRPIEVIFSHKGIETRVDNLAVRFDIVMDMEGVPNGATIDIYNAPLSLQAKIGDRYTNVTIRVTKGTIFDAKAEKRATINLFSGQVTRYKKGRHNNEDVLQVIASDSQKIYNNIFISRSFTGVSATLKRILQSIVQDADGLTFGGMFGLPDGYAFKRGLALCGTLDSVMQFFSVTFNADWYIESNALYFVRRGAVIGAIASEPVSPRTGMVDLPRPTLTGVVVKSALRPELRVGGQVQVNTPVGEGAGLYKLRRIQHNGFSGGMPWHSTLTLYRTEDEPPVKMRSVI